MRRAGRRVGGSRGLHRGSKKPRSPANANFTVRPPLPRPRLPRCRSSEVAAERASPAVPFSAATSMSAATFDGAIFGASVFKAAINTQTAREVKGISGETDIFKATDAGGVTRFTIAAAIKATPPSPAGLPCPASRAPARAPASCTSPGQSLNVMQNAGSTADVISIHDNTDTARVDSTTTAPSSRKVTTGTCARRPG